MQILEQSGINRTLERHTGQIRLAGRPVAEVLPEAAMVYRSLEELKQTYQVTWD